ncbi:hypothetical protein O0I10_011745 [Lichtheimia ornata]|uniref:Helicase ATP-binding domain-containing protein n=1 Tax=Lichtheimia ornata TaxID=688661 RepID=A0AAD7US72_9FUNG|nr:uncharacterized protein O0I10_011745 [Lichtheimia ornata]KAJ8652599.1 hypothetical protein O0I10_011745 [Lichtheimia ornata]
MMDSKVHDFERISISPVAARDSIEQGRAETESQLSVQVDLDDLSASSSSSSSSSSVAPLLLVSPPPLDDKTKHEIMTQCLAALHGPEAQPRSPEQAAGILHSLFGNEDVFIVMPTVVIVPLLAFLHDLKRRALEHHIQYLVWKGERVDEGMMDVDIIFVQLEKCQHPNFKNSFESLAPHVGRIVYDEAHMHITEYRYLRKAIDAALALRMPGVPVFCMRATLPMPLIQKTFKSKLWITYYCFEDGIIEGGPVIGHARSTWLL